MLMVGAGDPTTKVLVDTFGFTLDGSEGQVVRLRPAGAKRGTAVDVRTSGGAAVGRQGAGSVHHVAFRAADDAAEAQMRAAAVAQGLRPTEQIDRRYFHSVYFREPGGVLLEIATDGPGFTLDEPMTALGSSVMLPPWYEPQRAEILAALPPLA
jgi:glyoxalase family protein